MYIYYENGIKSCFFDINTIAKLGFRIRVDKSTFYLFRSVKNLFYVITKNNNKDNK